MTKSNIEIHLIFADNLVARFLNLADAYEFLVGHFAHLKSRPIATMASEDVLLGVLSSGLSTEDETFINRQVALNIEFQTRSSTDDKSIQ